MVSPQAIDGAHRYAVRDDRDIADTRGLICSVHGMLLPRKASKPSRVAEWGGPLSIEQVTMSLGVASSIY